MRRGSNRRRTLQVRTADGLRPLHAASGLVHIGEFLYVIADDELYLARFRVDDDLPGELLPLLAGELPVAPAARKQQKPDWEALLHLPPDPDWPAGALLVLASGSRPNRQQAVIVPLDETGNWIGTVRRYPLDALYQTLLGHLHELNIEAALIQQDELLLLSRGNQRQPETWLFRFRLSDCLRLLRSPSPAAQAPVPLLGSTTLRLPRLAGAVASITDATALADGRWLATVVAEASNDAYHDGACVGAAIALFDVEHRLQGWWPMPAPVKYEGLAATAEANGWQLWLVNDPDSRTEPSGLFEYFLSAAENSASR